MAFMAASKTTVLFGGLDDNNKILGDTWAWDGKAWIEIKPKDKPNARRAHSMACQASNQKVFLFGGESSFIGKVLNDS